MAPAAEKTTEPGTQPVGSVVIINDKAKAISPDGTERLLAVESPIFAQDRIITEGNGRVSIVIDDNVQTQIDLDGRNDIIIDEDIFGGVSSELVAQASAGVEQVHEVFIIQDIDLTADPETPAADSVATADGGNNLADFDHVNHEGDIFKTAADKISVIFDQSDYTDMDNGSPLDPLDNLIDSDDSTS
jgi:hypothetical protein